MQERPDFALPLPNHDEAGSGHSPLRARSVGQGGVTERLDDFVYEAVRGLSGLPGLGYGPLRQSIWERRYGEVIEGD